MTEPERRRHRTAGTPALRVRCTRRRTTTTTATRHGACVVLLLAALGCGSADQDEDLDAMGACSRAVEVRAPGQAQRATVRDDGTERWVVNVWTDRPAEGAPDHVCQVVRDEEADEGFRVESLRP